MVASSSAANQPWTRREDTYLEQQCLRASAAAMAVALGRTPAAVLKRMQALGLRSGRYWSSADIAWLKANYGVLGPVACAQRLGCSVKRVWNAAKRHGLTSDYVLLTPARAERIRELVGLGWCNAHIAADLGGHRAVVRVWRRRLGLPAVGSRGAVASCGSCRAQSQEALQRQLVRAGVASLGQVRSLAHRRYAVAHGWPEDLRPRAVQILDLLWFQGPQTRREIAARLGMSWKSTRKALCSNDPGGSYLAYLMARGLVVVFPRLHRVSGRGRGYSSNVYALAITAQKGGVLCSPANGK